MKLEIHKGQKFKNLTVIKELPRRKLPSGQYNRMFLVRCDCGKTNEVRLLHLSRGRMSTCGKCPKVIPEEEKKLSIYRRWCGMKDRCRPTHSESHLYYDKGVRVCKEWGDYYAFKIWAYKNGYSDDLQIDRIDSDKGYNPNNCRWVTPIVNANNRCVTYYVKYKGVKYAFSLLLREKGLFKHYDPIRCRIKRGWSVEKAIDTPIRKGNYGRKIKQLQLCQQKL
jgi:hypothetical protein